MKLKSDFNLDKLQYYGFKDRVGLWQYVVYEEKRYIKDFYGNDTDEVLYEYGLYIEIDKEDRKVRIAQDMVVNDNETLDEDTYLELLWAEHDLPKVLLELIKGGIVE